MKLVVLGAPGAGKGTQGRNLSKHYSIPHISTGDILRNEMKNKTEIGNAISELMDKGILVSDEIVTGLLKERIKNDDCKNGFILDGYPRTLSQAGILDTITSIDRVISVEVTDEVIIERMTGRYMCSECGFIYHLVYHPPKEHLICDKCGGKLIQRDDDKAKTVINRLETYHKVTEPIKEFYKAKDVLILVDGTKEINEITDEIVVNLGECK